MICKYCGALNEDYQSECAVCGAHLQDDVWSENTYSQQSFQRLPTGTVSAPIQPPKKKKGAKIAIIIVVIILILCMCPLGIFGGFIAFSTYIGVKMTESQKVDTSASTEPYDEGWIEDYEYDDYDDYDDYEDDDYYDEYSTDGYYEKVTEFPDDDYIYDTDWYYNDETETIIDDNSNTSTDFSEYLGYYYTSSGYKENGPCYWVDLLSFDSTNGIAVFSIHYLGKNASPYYTSGYITVTLDESGYGDFTWDDGWENSGIGNIRFVEGSNPTIELEVIVTEKSEWNRASLTTNGVLELYYY